ncbi:Putative dihydroflavonol 4-reductase [Linum perenne]
MKVLVTGASGYVGNQLCHALRKQGYSVRALLRHTSDLSSLPSSPDDDFEIIYGDITDYGSLLSAFDGCTAVFHAAGLTEMWLPDPSQFFKVNVEGMMNIVQAARETPTVEKIVCTLSASALGPTAGHSPADETKIHSEKKFSSEYERSQVAALKVAMEAGAEGVPIVVVYLCIVYGPGKLTAGNLIAHLLVEQFKGGILGRTEFGKNVVSFGHIDDVVKGHIDAMKRGKVGEAYLLTGQNVSFEHVFDLAAKLTSKPKPKIRFPLWVIEILGWFLVLGYRFTGRLPYVTPPVVNTYRQEWAFSCEKAKLHFDYNPRNLEDGVLDVIVWLKGIKLIDY